MFVLFVGKFYEAYILPHSITVTLFGTAAPNTK